MKIMLLDNKTIEKIAAGEVIERPSSIVKELIENSIDANSKNITVEIKNGGKSYIRITDDGDGIDYDDLDLAFKRYSTSKLSSVEDLFKIKSLGFRGEALASISQVSKLEAMTKREDAIGGTHVIVEEGEIISKEIIGCPKGTTMIVKDLFYNFPVRKEFLKSDLIESNHISDILYKIAVGNPNISFKFIKDDKVLLKTSRDNNMKSHIYSILGKEFSNNMIEINLDDYGIKLNGYISNNNLYRSNRNHQYIYVNGRYVNNSSISSTIENHYKTLIPINRFPCFIVCIELDPSTIDVNIHPTKQEVKFANQSDILLMLEKAVKDALFPSLSISKIKINQGTKIVEEEKLPLLFDLQSNNIEKEIKRDKKRDIIVKDFTTKTIVEDKILVKEDNNEEFMSQDMDFDNKANNIDNILSSIKPIGILFNTYILAEDKLSEKLYFIDQHAAHERVMYEKYLEEFNNESIIMQQLLIPEILELTSLEMNVFVNNISLFQTLGFDVEEFGNNSVVLRAVPMIFGEPNIRVLFYDLLDNINNIKSSYDTKLEKIMKIACTKAIKSGDKMSDLEVISLFEQLKKTNNPHTCPHGRPIILEMTKLDIEKAFLRII